MASWSKWQAFLSKHLLLPKNSLENKYEYNRHVFCENRKSYFIRLQDFTSKFFKWTSQELEQGKDRSWGCWSVHVYSWFWDSLHHSSYYFYSLYIASSIFTHKVSDSLLLLSLASIYIPLKVSLGQLFFLGWQFHFLNHMIEELICVSSKIILLCRICTIWQHILFSRDIIACVIMPNW